MRHNNYLTIAIVHRSAARDVEQWGRRYNIATVSDINCNASDETLEYCKDFLEKYPEAQNLAASVLRPLMLSFIANKKRKSHADYCKTYNKKLKLNSTTNKTYTRNDVILVKRCMIRVFRFSSWFFSRLKPTRCTSFSNLFYLLVALCMFWTVFPSIVRSLRLYIQHQVYVRRVLPTAC